MLLSHMPDSKSLAIFVPLIPRLIWISSLFLRHQLDVLFNTIGQGGLGEKTELGSCRYSQSDAAGNCSKSGILIFYLSIASHLFEINVLSPTIVEAALHLALIVCECGLNITFSHSMVCW